MPKMLPILFNTDSMRKILEGRKSVVRKIIKPQPVEGYFTFVYQSQNIHIRIENRNIKSPYQPGDILYVRETWERFDCCSCEGDVHGNCPKGPEKSVLDKYGCGCYMYRATDKIEGDAKWHSAISMPKEAARIWLKVMNVRVERLQDITEEQAQAEGCNSGMLTGPCTARGQFENLWNSTIKKADLDTYGWDANPWVWVIEFERCEKPKELQPENPAKKYQEIIKENFSKCSTVEELCKVYAEFRSYLDEQMKITAHKLTEKEGE